MHPKGTNPCWVRLGGEALASISICACPGTELSPPLVFLWGQRMQKGFPPRAEQHLPRWAEQLLLQDFNHLLMASKHRRWLHLATQLRICISKERRALPSPPGKIDRIASCWWGISGAGIKGSLILRRGNNRLHQLLIIPPTLIV